MTDIVMNIPGDPVSFAQGRQVQFIVLLFPQHFILFFQLQRGFPGGIPEGIVQKLNRQGATIIYTSHYMEEVEQIASRIAIMDKGKIIAMGTNEELKKMIKSGEHINLELLNPEDLDLDAIKALPHIISAELSDHQLVVKSGRGKNNLIAILDQLKDQSIAIGKVYSEPPTLNDVFLEITGKELRD